MPGGVVYVNERRLEGDGNTPLKRIGHGERMD
jgi:hypothetical protein